MQCSHSERMAAGRRMMGHSWTLGQPPRTCILPYHAPCLRAQAAGKGFSPAQPEVKSQKKQKAPAPAPAPVSTNVAPQGEPVIYNMPQLYQAAFSWRAIKDEVKFLQKIHKLHSSTGSNGLTSVLDLGCGPGEHAIGLAAAGVACVVGMDMNSSMLEHARAQAASNTSLKSSPTFIQGDITQVQEALRQQSHTSSFDMVMCLLGTLTHCLTNKDAAAVFKGAAQALAPGGLLILELTHPGDLFDGTLVIGDGGKEIWEVPQGPDRKLMVEWGSEFDDFDPVTQVIDRTVSIHVMHGEDVQQTVEEVVPARQFTVQEIELLADAAGLKVKELYGDMMTAVDLQHEDAYRMVAVLQKPRPQE